MEAHIGHEAHVSAAGKHAAPLGKAALPTAVSISVALHIAEQFL